MVLDRSNVDAKYKWDLTKIYKTEEDFYVDYKIGEPMTAGSR